MDLDMQNRYFSLLLTGGGNERLIRCNQNPTSMALWMNYWIFRGSSNIFLGCLFVLKLGHFSAFDKIISMSDV